MHAVVAILILILLMAVSPIASGEVLPPASAFARLPAISMVRLSPDGTRIAWAGYERGESLVTIFDLTDRAILRTARTDTGYKLRRLQWVDDEILLIEISKAMSFPSYTPTKDIWEVFRFLALDATGGPARALLMDDPNRRQEVISFLIENQTIRDGRVIMDTSDVMMTGGLAKPGWRFNRESSMNRWVSTLFDVDARTGAVTRLAWGTPYTSKWIVGKNGEPFARAEWNSVRREFSIEARVQGNWKTLYTGSDPNELDLMGRTADEQAVIAVGARGEDRELAWRLPLDGSSFTVLVDTEESVERTINDRFTGAVSGLQLGGLRQQVHWLDPKLEKLQRAINAAFPERLVAILDYPEDNSRVLASVEGPGNPPVFYLVDVAKGTADTIGEAYPELGAVQLGISSSISYRARDGMEIPAYLTLPPDGEPEGLPLILLPHKGPDSRDNSGFDWWAQFLATRGYAVLRPQYRGSTGFGTALRLAGTHAWGQSMQDDLSDGVAAMVEQGIADPARVCIVGLGYGGYAALAGATLTPELYACAASVNGIADLAGMYRYLRSRYGQASEALASWVDEVGSPFDPDISRLSPIHAVTSVRAPILLLHGTDNIQVPFTQSEQFANALSALGKPHELIPLKDEDHWLSTAAGRLQVLQALETFLAKHLAPSP